MIKELAEEGFKKVGYIADTKLLNGLNKTSYVQGFNDGFNKALEKLKCCENCDYHSFWGDELKCNYGLKEALVEDKLVECHNLDKWKMKSD